MSKFYRNNVFSWATLALVSCEPVEYEGPVMQMAAPADYLDFADLKAVAAGGIVKEDTMNQIFDISDIPTPFLDAIGTDSYSNAYADWLEDKLAAPDITNKVISGSDSTSAMNDATRANTKRVGNHAQISTKDVQVTERGNAVDVFATSEEMGYQTAQRFQELRRDVEAISLTGQASVEDNGNNVAGQSAGAAAWIVTNDSGGVGASAPGFQTGTKLVTVVTPGESRSGTWEMIADQIEAVFILGGNPSVLMSVPQVTKRIGRYLFTTPYAAAPTANVNGSGDGVAQTSQGYIDTFKTDFGTLMTIVPNRLQQTYASGDGSPVEVANVFGLDMRYWKLSLLYGWKVDPLGKKGLSHWKLLHVDWMLKCLLERANFVVRDINPTAAWASGL